MGRLRKWLIGIGAALAFIAALVADAFRRGKRSGKATQTADDARARIEDARKKGDTEAIDKEWKK